MLRIVHSSIDENGKATGGKAGDQTGKEVCVRNWYDKNWSVMLRYPDSNISISATEIAIKLASSNLVGYDQNQRNTLYNELKKNDFNVDKYIATKVKTESDCSSFVYACYACLLPHIRSNDNAPRTGNMEKQYQIWGFGVYKDNKYIKEYEYLKKGDLLVRPNGHTVMVIDNGSKSESVTTPISDYCDVTLPILSKGDKGKSVMILQLMLEFNGMDVGSWGIDGDFGKDTKKAVEEFQRQNNISVNGVISSESWYKLIC